MKIRSVSFNDRKKSFEVKTHSKVFSYPYAKLETKPGKDNPVVRVFVDGDLGREAFTYLLESGEQGSVHMEQVLEYNQDPSFLRDMLVYKLTVDAQQQVAASLLSRREIIRRLGTSASQFYRLLDQTNYSKSVDQLLKLLSVLECEVDVVVRARSA